MIEWEAHSIAELIECDAIQIHKDGNHGANYPRAGDFGADGLPFLTAKSLSDWKIDLQNAPRLSEEKASSFTFGFVDEGDVLLSHNATVGRVALVPKMDGPAVIGTSLTQFRVDTKRIDPKFLAIYFSSPGFQDQLSAVMAQTTRNQVPITAQRRLSVVLPPIDVQGRIAEVIFSLNDKIEINRRMSETLEAMIQAIFSDWFVDFGPTRAKAKGCVPYLPKKLWDKFPRVFENKDRPIGWRSGTLNEIADSPRRSVKPSEVAKNTPYIGLEHMPRQSIALSEWGEAGKVKSNKSAFKEGEFLFGKLRPYFHKVGVAPTDGICSTDIVVIVPREPEWNAYTIACISSQEFVSFTDQTSTGTKMPRTSWKTMGQYEICIPTREVAATFSDTVEPLLRRIGLNIHESRMLSQARDLLLPKLVSGEIQLADAMQATEAVA